MMMLITIDDDHDGHDDDVFLAGWGSFEASNFRASSEAILGTLKYFP